MTNRVEYNVRRGDSPDGREVRTGRTRLCISDTWFNNRIFIGILYFYPFSRAVAPIAYAGYLFEIDTNGRYKISLSKNFSLGTQNTTLQDWTASSALKTGSGVKNTLQVLARGSSLSFYINGVFLAPGLQDTAFSTGNIAFLATSLQGNQSADVVYSNLSVFVSS